MPPYISDMSLPTTTSNEFHCPGDQIDDDKKWEQTMTAKEGTLHFSRFVTIHEIPSRHDLTIEEHRNTWRTKEDIALNRMEMVQTIQMLLKHKNTDEAKEHLRGLESFQPGHIQKHRKVTHTARYVVMRIQRNQGDASSMAVAYEIVCKTSKRDAYRLGCEDHKRAREER